MIRHTRYTRIVTVVLWAAILMLVISALLLLPTVHTIQSRAVITNEQMARLEQSGVITKAVDVIDLQKRARVMKEKLAAQLPVPPMEYVERIRAYEDSGIKMTGYKINSADKPILQIYGVAMTRQTLQRFIAALQADPTIQTVDSPVTNFVKSTQSSFMITVTFKAI